MHFSISSRSVLVLLSQLAGEVLRCPQVFQTIWLPTHDGRS